MLGSKCSEQLRNEIFRRRNRTEPKRSLPHPTDCSQFIGQHRQPARYLLGGCHESMTSVGCSQAATRTVGQRRPRCCFGLLELERHRGRNQTLLAGNQIDLAEPVRSKHRPDLTKG